MLGHYNQVPPFAWPPPPPVLTAPAVYWIDASDTGTITAAGSAVTQVADKVNSFVYREDTRMGHVGPATGLSSIGGLNALRFDGNSALRTHIQSSDPGLIDMSDLNAAGGLTFACVIENMNDANAGGQSGNRWLSWMGGNIGFVMHTIMVAGTNGAGDLGAAYTSMGFNSIELSNVLQSASKMSSGHPYIYAMTLTLPPVFVQTPAAIADHAYQLNGYSSGIGTEQFANYGDADPSIEDAELILGQLTSGQPIGSTLLSLGTTGFNGNIGEMFMLEGAQDLDYLTGYLAHKWNLAGSLPVMHPYKVAPPATPIFTA